MKNFIFTIAMLCLVIPVFGQGDLTNVPSTIKIKFQKKEVNASGMKMYVRVTIQGNSNKNIWCVLSAKGTTGLETNRMQMYHPCGKGCIGVYKFTGKSGFYVLNIPPHSSITLDSLVLDGYAKNDNPSSIHASFTEALIVEGGNFAERVKTDPATAKQVSAAMSASSMQYDKEVLVGNVSQGEKATPLVLLAPQEVKAPIEDMPEVKKAAPLNKPAGKK